MSTICSKQFTMTVDPGVPLVDCSGVAASIQDATWTQISTPLAGTITIIGGDGVFSSPSITNPFVQSEGYVCNPTLVPYAFTVEIDWTVTGLDYSFAYVTLNGGIPDSSGPMTGNGNASWTFNGQIVSGVNSIVVYVVAAGLFDPGTLSGTVMVRPLTPP